MTMGLSSTVPGGQWVDLTHAFSESTIYWPTDTAGFRLEELAFGPTEGGWFYASYQFSSAEHGGTHLDAPIHFAEGRRTNEQIPLSGLIGPSAVVDVTARITADYLVSPDDLTSWEAVNGEIPDGGIVLIRTGWEDRWGDRTAYLGTDLTGEAAVAELHFPGIGAEAAQWAGEQPRDRRRRHRHPQHRPRPICPTSARTSFSYAENIVGFENVANLGALPRHRKFRGCAADEDRRREWRAAPDRRVRSTG